MNPNNNSKTLKISTIQNNPVRKVLFEEATGTWCGNCPRGEVAMQHMDTLIKDHTFIGISVHTQSNDPMTIAEYETGMNNAGKPTCNVDRLPDMHELDIPSNPFQVSNYYYSRQFAATPTEVTQNISYNSATRNVTIVANADFRTKISNEDLRFASIIIEDSLKGVGQNWNQANAYSDGSLGPMFGYEKLPSSIPGFVYNHVGRVLIGGYYGLASSMPSSVDNGNNVSYTFNYTLPTKINPINAQVVTLAIDARTGEVLNATKDPISTKVGISNLEKEDFEFEVFPNPSIDNKFNISFKALSLDNYNIQIYTLSGNLISEKRLGKIVGEQKVNFELPSNIANGAYLLMINNSKTSYAKNILVSK
ncbi:MAG: Omp28-related outer membrane protein [Saprospiraceae bacterium]|nr:Omp28-related outer membrane protein [Saprospiraceae bacterium]